MYKSAIVGLALIIIGSTATSQEILHSYGEISFKRYDTTPSEFDVTTSSLGFVLNTGQTDLFADLARIDIKDSGSQSDVRFVSLGAEHSFGDFGLGFEWFNSKDARGDIENQGVVYGTYGLGNIEFGLGASDGSDVDGPLPLGFARWDITDAATANILMTESDDIIETLASVDYNADKYSIDVMSYHRDGDVLFGLSGSYEVARNLDLTMGYHFSDISASDLHEFSIGAAFAVSGPLSAGLELSRITEGGVDVNTIELLLTYETGSRSSGYKSRTKTISDLLRVLVGI